LPPSLIFEENRKGYAVLQGKFIRRKFLKYVAFKLCNLYPLYILPSLLTPWSGVLEKLTGSQLVKQFPYFTKDECLLPHLQVPANRPYPIQFNHFLKVHLNIIFEKYKFKSLKLSILLRDLGFFTKVRKIQAFLDNTI